MLFHTHLFLLVFLPVAVGAYWTLAPRVAPRPFVLTCTGIAFYSFAGLAPLALLLAMTAATFWGVRGLAPGSAHRTKGLAVIALNLAVLTGFKLATASPLGGSPIVPLGLSFFTFNLVSYGLDVYQQGTAPASSFISLASYATFFPTVTAGPLLRYDGFRKQQEAPPSFDAALVERGLFCLVVGLAKKVLVADPLGITLEPIFASYESLGFVDGWLAVLGYAYQLYFDFSGYSDMATGVAALLGFRIPQNFNAPYTAVHITEFWQRWHMSMSQWFRDYLFLPLSRSLLRRRPLLEGAGGVRAQSMILTMAVVGLWHGSSWNFLAWGLFQGFLLAGHARVRVASRFSMPRWLSRALTFVAVLAGWVLLRCPSPAMAWRVYEAMLGFHGWGDVTVASRAGLGLRVLLLLVLTNVSAETYLRRPRRSGRYSLALAALLVLSLLSMGARSPFLYFQF